MQTINAIPFHILKNINYNLEVSVCFLHCFCFLWVTFIGLLILISAILAPVLTHINIAGHMFMCKSKALKGHLVFIAHFRVYWLMNFILWWEGSEILLGDFPLLPGYQYFVSGKSLFPTKNLPICSQKVRRLAVAITLCRKVSCFRRHSPSSTALGPLLLLFRKYLQVLSWKQKPLQGVTAQGGEVGW